MSNGELLERLLDMVKFGWMLLDCPIAEYCPKLSKTLEYCTKLSKIVEYCTSAQGPPHPEYSSFNHCHHPTPYSQ